MRLNRRGLVGALLCAPAVLLGQNLKNPKRTYGDPDQNDKHHWRKGKLWVLTTTDDEEPKFYPPSALLQLEYCVDCGILRLPKRDLGSSLNS